MIEAVNSTLSNAQSLRNAAELAARSISANPARVQEAAATPQAPFVSPYISLDINYDRAVLQIRDSDTGDVLRQFPSEARMQAESRSKADAGGLFVASQAREVGVNKQAEKASSEVAQAQIASQALSAGAQTDAPQSLSAGVSVLA